MSERARERERENRASDTQCKSSTERQCAREREPARAIHTDTERAPMRECERASCARAAAAAGFPAAICKRTAVRPVRLKRRRRGHVQANVKRNRQQHCSAKVRRQRNGPVLGGHASKAKDAVQSGSRHKQPPKVCNVPYETDEEDREAVAFSCRGLCEMWRRKRRRVLASRG